MNDVTLRIGLGVCLATYCSLKFLLFPSDIYFTDCEYYREKNHQRFDKLFTNYK